SPTLHAVSSETPNFRSLGLPDLRISPAASATAFSTQPPETDPAILRPSATAIFPPTARGADPHVATTVASATRRPSARHFSMSPRTSRMGRDYDAGNRSTTVGLAASLNRKHEVETPIRSASRCGPFVLADRVREDWCVSVVEPRNGFSAVPQSEQPQ